MNTLKLSAILKNCMVTNKRPNFSPILSRWYSKNEHDKPEKSDGKEKLTDKKDEKSALVLNKLHNLLKEMTQEPAKEAEITLKLSKPVPKREIKSSEKVDNKEVTVVKVVKEVAEELGQNTKQTELELMKKLLNTNEDENASISTLSDIFKGMKIDRNKPHVEQQSRSQQVKNILDQTQRHRQRRNSEGRTKPRPHTMQRREHIKPENIDLFGSEPLGIFTSKPDEYTDGVKTTTWEALSQKEMKLAITHPPSNYFQEMILWTEQGKLWKFPIDNEQGLEEEQNISFAEHIFLEKHLEPWCPPKGPIRHFMELVCVGLSKNPYLTVDAKKEHIEWYRNYFEDKRQLLKEVGASLNEPKKTETIEST